MAAAKVVPADPARSRLLLLDGHSLAYRAFFALPVENFSTTDGQPTNAVYGFTAMLINVLRDEQPTHLAVAFDVARRPSGTRRTPTTRPAGPRRRPTSAARSAWSSEVLDALRVPVVSKPGFEADDVIATLATQAAGEGMDVLIVTGDRDAFQLVSDRVTVLYNSRGVSDMRRMTPAAVEEKYGLSPEQYPEFAALRGDPSDNLPNVPGLGEKTATKLIQQYGDVGALIDQVDEVKGKIGDSLRAHAADVAAQPPAHRARPRRAPRGRPARPAARPVGPRRGAQGLRRPAVPGPARAALRDAVGGRARGRAGVRGRGPGARARRGAGLPRRAAARRTGRGARAGHAGAAARATPPASGWPLRRRRRGSRRARTTPRTST